jgi:hypothetical protein
MFPNRILMCSFALFTLPLRLGAQGALTDDQLKMLHDPGGWEYIKIGDVDNGIQTQHTCFDGHPHPQQCSGTLTLSPGNSFVQKTRIHGQTVQRHGTYELDGNQLTFFDELGTKDGPYALNINTQAKRLVLQMRPVRIDLELESQYRKDRQNQKQPPPLQ